MKFRENNFRIDFIGIGAGKSGTSWLAGNLKKHPSIYLSDEKELTYFNKFTKLPNNKINYRSKKSYQWYHSNFKNAKTGQLCGEFSPAYMKEDGCAASIYKYNPGVKLLAILRNPIERGISSFYFRKSLGMTKHQTFEDSIRKETDYLKFGLYYEQLTPFYNLFPKENIKIVLYDDLVADPKAIYYEVLDFLNLKRFLPNDFFIRKNVTTIPKSHLFSGIIHSTLLNLKRYPGLAFLTQLGNNSKLKNTVKGLVYSGREKLTEKPEINEKDLFFLKEFYSDDLCKLELLLHKDLSHWK